VYEPAVSMKTGGWLVRLLFSWILPFLYLKRKSRVETQDFKPKLTAYEKNLNVVSLSHKYSYNV